MLFQLKPLSDESSSIYLFSNQKYTVGRKDCDILIIDDKSISRRHSILTIEDKYATLLDYGAKYNTFINGVKIESNKEFILKDGDEIQFGVLTSKYKFQIIALVTTTSSISTEQKIKLKSNMKYLGGTLLQNWSSECTHVTVKEIILTVKVLCAIIRGIPIVNTTFWEDYVKNIKQNNLPPNPLDYRPKCSEIMINENMSLDYLEERCSLFKNKVFVFPTKNDAIKVQDMIKLAGGEALSFDSNPISLNDIKNSSKEHLIVQINENDVNIETSLLEIINYNKRVNKRRIPLQEIALALVHCSCEKDCNPNFDRKSTVFAPRIQNFIYSEKALVLETQTQDDTQKNAVTSEVVIAGSLEDLPASIDSFIMKSPASIDSSIMKSIEDYSEKSENLTNEGNLLMDKRKGESLDHMHIAKKKKKK